MTFVKHIIKRTEKTDENLSTTNAIIILNALSLLNYSPKNLRESFWSKIWTSELFSNQTQTQNVDWINVTLNLIALNKFDWRLIENVLSDDYLREAFDSAESSPETTNRYLSLLAIFQSFKLAQDLGSDDDYNMPQLETNINNNRYLSKAVEIHLNSKIDCPIQNFLETEFGCDKVLTLVKSKYGHGIQHILKLDKVSGNLLTFNETLLINRDEKFIKLEDIECGQDETL